MSLLSNVTTLMYNGYSFDVTSRVTVKGKPLYDQADRAVIAMIYTITVVGVIQSNSTTGESLISLRKRLSKPGQDLRYLSSGFGDLRINVSSVRDVMWGPKPRVIDWKPIGSAQACEITWQVEVAIPECDNAKYQFRAMAFNYEVDFSIDGDGYTTRHYSGYIEIPMTRINGGRQMPDTVDRFWEDVCPVIPSGFKRKERTRRISMDKRRMDFTIVDEQIPGGGFPPGITDFSGSHRVEQEPNNWIRFTSVIDATYTVAPGRPRSDATAAFFALLMDRAKVSKGKGRLFVGFSSTEGLGTNRKVSFSSSWTFLSNVADCMLDGGQWRPVPNTNWRQWITSPGVAEAQSPRGHAGLKHVASEDVIVDLCVEGDISILKRSTPDESSMRSRLRPPRDSTPIEPENSWLKYRIKLLINRTDSSIRLKTLPEKPYSPGGMGSIPSKLSTTGSGGTGARTEGLKPRKLVDVAGATNKGNGDLVNDTVAAADEIQQRATPSYRAVITGMAVRAGYHVPIPKIDKIGGVKADESDQWTDEEIVANWSGIPIYCRRWILTYDLAEPPANGVVGAPGNPELMMAG